MKISYYIPLLFFSVVAKSQDCDNEFSFLKNYNKLPIKATRTISFTTNQGSYMDVDISPDSKTILFDLLGDLYTVPATGGVAKQLTRGLAINYFPSWSPDGKLIAYSSDASGDRRLHVRNLEGTFDHVFDKNAAPSMLMLYGKPRWMPDGNYIAFGNFLYHLAGGKIALKDANLNGTIIGYSNDGKFLYTEYPYSDSSIIGRYEKDSWEKTVLKGAKAVSLYARVSPDGRWLTYIKRNNHEDTMRLMAYDIRGGKEKFLAFVNTKYPGYGFPQYSFSSDSKKLFIGYAGKIHKIDIETGDNESIPFTASVHVDMGPLNYNTFRVSNDSLKVHYTRWANASPDGKHLVFSALNRVYIMNLPNGKPRILTPQPFAQFCPVFSPDGKWIAYVSWSDTAGGQVWRVPVAGGNPEQLTHTAAIYQSPNWSPDGLHIVVVKGKAENEIPGNQPEEGQILLIDMNEREQVVAEKVPFYNSPAFSANGFGIIYNSNQANLKLVETTSDNKNTTALANGINPTSSTAFRQVIISPDQRYLVYTENEDLFLAPVLTPGQAMTVFDGKRPLPVIRFAEGAFDPHWEQNGKILSWSYANKYFQVKPEKIIVAAIKQAQEENIESKAEKSNVIVKVVPDKIISINLVVPCHYAKGTVVLKNARIISMKGDQVIEHGTIIISDGRFVAVRESNKIKTPPGAAIFDLTGKTLMPGFIDLHAHYQNAKRDVFPEQSWKLLVNLAYGVTTARNPSAGHDEFGYSELLEEGSMLGPRLYSSGQAVRSHYRITDLNEARSVVNNHVKDNGIFIKQYLLDTRLQHQWLLLASKEAGMNMTNEYDLNPLNYIGMVKDGSTGIEHNPSWGNVYKDVVTLLAKAGTYYTPTLQVYGAESGKFYFRNLYYYSLEPKLERFTPKRKIKENLHELNSSDIGQSSFIKASKINAALVHRGARIGLGSHGEDQGVGAHFELWALQMGGLSNLEALRCATLTGAEALGIQKDVGSIEVGKIADLIVLDSNPLEDIHNTTTIRYVMKNGILYDGDTLDTLWPEKKKLPAWR